MSELTDDIAAVSASADAMTERVKQHIAALEAAIANGTETPEDKANLADLKARLDAVERVAANFPRPGGKK